MAGAIIGAKGLVIGEIRDLSGAHIGIDLYVPGNTHRIITIDGTSEQIEHVKYMMQKT